MAWTWLGIAALAGILLPVQAAVNSRMREHVGQPLASTLVNFVVGTVALLAYFLVLALRSESPKWSGALEAPWWAWLGGLMGVAFVTATVVILPHTGTASYTVALVGGQMLGALILDHYGWLGVPQQTLTAKRVAAAGLLFVAVWLIQSE